MHTILQNSTRFGDGPVKLHKHLLHLLFPGPPLSKKERFQNDPKFLFARYNYAIF